MQAEVKRRISFPAPYMRPHYDVVVVGSGYGGGIAACRMSRAGKRVALLEKGSERWPGEYPNDEVECLKEIQVSSPAGHNGKRDGLYHFHLGNGQNAFVGCGLGGTSLLNANVALEADSRVWGMSVWPEEINNDYDSIKQGYDRAKEMLQPTPYPDNFPELPKLKALEEQAKRLGPEFSRNFSRPPITVTFETRENAAGVRQEKSTLTGNDTTGVNDGSKNTTLVNYVSDAWNHGCEIFCEVDVKRVKKDKKSGKWIVFYEWLNNGRETFVEDSHHSFFFVTADTVFLAAGTFGTAEILLRSQTNGLEISSQLGQGFSGNGDILAFGYNTDLHCNAVAMGNINPSDFKEPVGPCITGIIDMRDTGSNVTDGYVIEEGVIPYATASIANNLLKICDDNSKAQPKSITLNERLTRSLRKVASSTSNYRGAVANTQTYLIMSHDDNTGYLELRDDRLHIEYEGAGHTKTVKKLNDILEEATTGVNGTFIPSPLWTKPLGSSLITVHPIGGCNMGRNGYVGVVNHKGQVYKNDGKDVHEDLYVCDGSIIPKALGVNPFLTISALAERICHLAAGDRGWTIDYKLVEKPINFDQPLVRWPRPHQYEESHELNRPPISAGITFTEVMRGYFSTEVTTKDFKAAEFQAKTANSTMQFLINIIAFDVNTLVDLDNHAANIFGTVSCRALSPDPLLIVQGRFRLFIKESDHVDANAMMYDLYLMATNGTRYRFEGIKSLNNGGALNALTEVTTLYVTVYEASEADENIFGDDTIAEERGTRKVVGRGILVIKPYDFVKQINTLKSIGPTVTQRVGAFFKFTGFFASTMLQHIFTPLLPLQYRADKSNITVYKKSRPTRRVFQVTADDGVKTNLYRYHGGKKGPVLLVHGASVTSEMFSTDLIKHNFLDYLLENKYDVFLIDYRVSPASPENIKPYSMEDCVLDLKAAVNEVRRKTGCEKIAMVSHCFGSPLTFMGLLSGEITGVGSLVASQAAMHPIFGFWNRIKNNLHLVQIFQKVLRQSVFDVRTSQDTNLLQTLINQMLRFYPVPAGGICHNALCHRNSLAFGTLYQHGNLTQELHDNLDEIMGPINLTTLVQLTTAAKMGKIVNSKGEDVYVTDDNVRNTLNFPICLIHGNENVVFDVEGIRQSYEELISINDVTNYTIHNIPNYGHLDCWWGTNSRDDIFPKVLRHLKDTEKLYGYEYEKLKE